MKVSLNTIKQYIDFELPPVDELVKRINEQLGGIDEVIDLADVYKDAVIVKVVECEKHPNADMLNVCRIDDGGKLKDIDRDEDSLIQVVCGAPNVHADMFAVWLPPRSIVPASYHDAEPFVLGARELRGIMSQGMLAAADELGLGSDHAGILEIDPTQWHSSDEKVTPGASFASIYGLDDTIIDIENKMFTHRPDLFGQLGVAREIAGILGHTFKSPNWYLDAPVFGSGEGLELEVFNEAGDNVPRFMTVAMKNVTIEASPVWLQCALVALGSKPINNIVDVTNYVMLLTAQPTHAYDYDKIRGHKIGARMAQDGETVELLNGKTYELTADDIVIADAEGPIGLGGIMGGGNSEVSADTKNIVLEVANFDMYAVRKSSMRHGIFTDALTRFNKGQSPLQNGHVLSLLVSSIKDVSTAEQAGDISDTGRVNQSPPVRISGDFVSARLGITFTDDTISQLLCNVEIDVATENGIAVSAPFWRTDLELPEDIVEEVGRLYGFDKLPQELPERSITPVRQTQMQALKDLIRKELSRLGASEILTYSFVHEKLLKKAGQDAEKAFKLSNALSPDLQYYRLSLLPSLLDKVHMNQKARHDSFALFEIGKAHEQEYVDEDGLPKEFERLGFVLAEKKSAQPAYYKAKRYLDELITKKIGIQPTYRPLDDLSDDHQSLTPYNNNRAGTVYVDDVLIGSIGEFSSSVRRGLKLPDATAGFEIDLQQLVGIVPKNQYVTLSRFPSVTQDLSVNVASNRTAASVLGEAIQALTELGDDWQCTTEIVSIYQAGDSDQKTISLRITVSNYEKSLTDKDVAGILADINARIAAS